ncbi:hypothetical protein [Cryobacterium luteum]|uniref:Helix-turn-helix domain-containing protein n=1 Tax=Cryobacterium luteum TaxID=1424661 RepID=A0A5F0D365_9MICO|nr:hypothetical protein [Cryobacterium luteum]TFB88625.1 hypothetical protein E3O10_12665 [Cryobacterium luteum]
MDSLAYDVAKPLAIRMLLKLANVAAQDGTAAYRNSWEVATELGVDRRSIMRALRELETAELIHKGDQRILAHIRADRRPTVYDLNFGYAREFGQPELPLPEDGEDVPNPDALNEWSDFHGVTEFSTGTHGVTNGVTTEVHLGTKRTNLTTLKKTALVPERAQAHESNTDASGDSLRDAAASAAPRPYWVGCGRLGHLHDLVADGSCCAVCGKRPPSYQETA